MPKTATINGFEIVGRAPKANKRPKRYMKHTALREALVFAPVGKWVVVPVPADMVLDEYRALLLQTFRFDRTGLKLTTRMDRESRKLFIARVA